jgi:PHP family Zn ribbon phosphoesterase
MCNRCNLKSEYGITTLREGEVHHECLCKDCYQSKSRLIQVKCLQCGKTIKVTEERAKELSHYEAKGMSLLSQHSAAYYCGCYGWS